jgi:dephospho-CoA kinase
MTARNGLRIGLTGGIGSGKTSVASVLAQLGAVVIDTDVIARQMSQPGGAALAEIRKTFGDSMIDAAGGLDRPRMRALVFSDPDAKRKLESILHPRIGVEAERQAKAAGGAICVFDIPLLTESSRWRAKVDRIVVVDCPEQTQIERVSARPGWSTQTAQSVIAQQAPRSARRACADAVIFNHAISLDELAAQVRSLWQLWCTSSPPAVGVERARL